MRGDSKLPAFAAALACAVVTPSCHRREETPPPPEEGIASVETAPVTVGELQARRTAYGTVVPAPGGERVHSAAVATRIRAVHVSAGQRVSKGDPLVDTDPSRDVSLQVEIARAQLATLGKTLDQAKERLELRLSTRQDLLLAQAAFDEARLRLATLEKSPGASAESIVAPIDGVVSAVLVREGEISAPDSPLVDIVADTTLEARLWIDTTDAGSIRRGEPVSLSAITRRAPIAVAGVVRAPGNEIDPQTRFVAVFVSLTDGSPLLLGEPVAGELTVRSGSGLVVPRAAAIPEDGHYVVYSVREGRARRHVVEVQLETSDSVLLVAPDLAPGDRAVVVGNRSLHDGMRVQTPSEPPR